jgi:anti-sigma B factor antagonist
VVGGGFVVGCRTLPVNAGRFTDVATRWLWTLAFRRHPIDHAGRHVLGMRSSAAPRGISGSWWRLVSNSAMILVKWVATQAWRWGRLAVSRSWGSMAHSRVGDYTVITTAGDLDVETAAALRDAIGVVVEAGQRQEVVDLDAVDFLDSAGLGVLIGGMTLVRAHGGSFGVVCRWDRTLNLLRITGVDQALEVHPNLAAMMASRPG